VWTKAQKDKQKTRRIKKIEVAKAAASKRYENAKQVLAAGMFYLNFYSKGLKNSRKS
jgi:hypothetical protein